MNIKLKDFMIPLVLWISMMYLTLFCICSSIHAKVPVTAKIVFASVRGGKADIYIMTPDGSEQKQLTRHPGIDLQPKWAPTGEQIIFVSDREHGIPDLFLMDPDGGNIQKVFRDTAHRTHPTYSPDGKRIAYLKDTDRAIYTARVNGEKEKQLVQVGKSNGEPTWSPDGTEIAFVSKIGVPIGGNQIRIINVESNEQEILLPDELPLMRSPAWSPSGEKIAFSWLDLNVWDVNVVLQWGGGNAPWKNETLYVVNRDGSRLRQILNRGNVGAVRPIWSPHGDELIYGRSEPSFQLFKIVLGSHDVIQLTDQGRNINGDWFDPTALPVRPHTAVVTTIWGELKLK